MAEDERQDNDEPTADGTAADGGAEETPAEEPKAEETTDEPTAGGPAADGGGEETPAEEPKAEEPAAEEAPAEEPKAEEAPAEEPKAEEAPAEEPKVEETPAEQPAAEQPPAERPRREREAGEEKKPDVVPGAHLEPDLVLDADKRAGEEDEYAHYAVGDEGEAGEAAAEGEEQAQPVARTPLDLAADARYKATGKRKTAVARVIVRPGGGSYKINGRTLEEFFPRETLQKTARQPLETAGYDTRMDVIARIHGGGVSSQAGALRHGIARALVEADPNLRTELKRRGFLTRDAREKERKKAGLKKARKRPQFSKR